MQPELVPISANKIIIKIKTHAFDKDDSTICRLLQLGCSLNLPASMQFITFKSSYASHNSTGMDPSQHIILLVCNDKIRLSNNLHILCYAPVLTVLS